LKYTAEGEAPVAPGAGDEAGGGDFYRPGVRRMNSRLGALRAIVAATKETGPARRINSRLEALRAIVGATKETGPVRGINSRLEALRAIVAATKETGR